jgi:hypothetical protein
LDEQGGVRVALLATIGGMRSFADIPSYTGGGGLKVILGLLALLAAGPAPAIDQPAVPSDYTINKQGYDVGEQRLLERASTLDAESGARLRDYAKAHKEFREAAMNAVQKVIDRGDDPLKLSQLAVPWESDGRKETMLGPAAIKQAYEYLKANGAR